jgi:hypothetical protein
MLQSLGWIIYRCTRSLFKLMYWIHLNNITQDNSSKALKHRLYQKGISIKNYLEILKDKDLFLLCRFRTSNHRLPIEIGPWENINRENKVCNFCQGRKLGEEFHYLARLIPQKYRCSPNTVKYCALSTFSKILQRTSN